MATKELSELRQRYNDAYTAYLASVQVLSDASRKGEWPERRLTDIDERSFAELASSRQDLWRALHAHTRKR